MKGKENNLKKEATFIHPIISKYYHLYEEKLLNAYDLVGIFILVYLAVRKPKTWANGRLTSPILPPDVEFQSIKLIDLPDVLPLLGESSLKKKLKASDEKFQTVTIIGLFNLLQFVGIKNNSDLHVNRCMVMWSQGQRPLKLMHYIPTPIEVLFQQANAERVVTMFTSLEELSEVHTSKLTYMSGMIEHSRDPLEFLTHDLKHMENFVDPMIHREQIGFFRAMSKINNGKVKSYFTKVLGCPIDLWYELEYVISDM
jgi:hypothetical protein